MDSGKMIKLICQRKLDFLTEALQSECLSDKGSLYDQMYGCKTTARARILNKNIDTSVLEHSLKRLDSLTADLQSGCLSDKG